MQGDEPRDQPADEAPPPPPAIVPPPAAPWVQPPETSRPLIPPRVLRWLGVLALIGLLGLAWIRVNVVLGNAVSREVVGSVWLGTALFVLGIAFFIRVVFAKVRRRDEPILSPWIPIMALAWVVVVTGIGLVAAVRQEAARVAAGPTPVPHAEQHFRITSPFLLADMDDETIRDFGLDGSKLPANTKRIDNGNGVRMGYVTAAAIDDCTPAGVYDLVRQVPGVKDTGRVEGVDTVTVDGSFSTVLWCEGPVLVGTHATSLAGAQALAKAVIRAPMPGASP